MLPITVRKRTICDADLPFIQAVIDEHWNCCRTQISKILCQKWNWIQPNGRLKDMACREVLVTLERQGHIKLPLGRHNGRNEKRNRFVAPVLVDQSPLVKNIADYGPVTMTMVRNTPLPSTTASFISIIVSVIARSSASISSIWPFLRIAPLPV